MVENVLSQYSHPSTPLSMTEHDVLRPVRRMSIPRRREVSYSVSHCEESAEGGRRGNLRATPTPAPSERLLRLARRGLRAALKEIRDEVRQV